MDIISLSEEVLSQVEQVKVKHKSKSNCNVAKSMSKPILSPELEAQAEAVVIQYKNAAKWRSWGLSHLRKQGNCVLMDGPPGTGKTILARYLSRKSGKGMIEVDISQFGSNVPGENERAITKVFMEAAASDKNIFIDEAESVLWNRKHAEGGSMWMVSVINHLLKAISEFRHLMLLASNYPQRLDPAIFSRLIAHIHIPRPEYPERLRLWETKLPKGYPVQPTKVQFQELANFGLTGREIENVIVRTAQNALLTKREPTFIDLCNVARVEEMNAKEVLK